MRIALGIEYDGRGFCGWERQRHCQSVQAEVERALGRVADEPVRTKCAGRTDAGVHALGQVVHFDTMARRSERSWLLGANANLPGPVAVQWARLVGDEFHARFSAVERHYRYVICNRPVRPALLAGRVTWERRPLDPEKMQAAAAALIGKHDFTSFRARPCQARHAVRTVYRLDVSRKGDLVLVDVAANGFLHHMVRNIAGVLIAVGDGRRAPGWVEEVLAARDRLAAGVTSPPDGLYLAGVRYPERFAIPRLSPPMVV